MAQNGISINLLADVREAVRGADNVADAMDQIADVLKDISREGDRSTDRMERDFKGVQREVDDTADAIKAKMRAAYKSVKDDSGETTTRAKQDLGELKNEALQNASETLSSFDGSIQGIADGIQGTFGGIVSSLGPAGAIGGALAAVGIGLGVALFEKSQEEAEKTREKVAELAAELLETGDAGGRSLEQITDRLQEIATTTEEGEISLSKLRSEARKAEVDYKSLTAAILDGGKDSIKVQEDILKKIGEEAAEYQRSGKLFDAPAAEKAAAQRTVYEALQKNIEIVKQAADTEQAWLEAGGQEYRDKAAQVSAINDAYDDAAGAVDDFLNEESGVFDVSKYINAMRKREKALTDYKDTLAQADLSPEAKRFLNEQGVESAALMVAGYKSASPKQRAELNRIWSEAGSESSGAFARSFDKSLPSTMGRSKVEFTADLKQVYRDLRSIKAPRIVVPADVIVRTRGRQLG